MLRIRKLYSHPEIFKPVPFEDGFNIILWSKTPKDEKTNGVGKSMCIEFINFCLLKSWASSRVLLIPEDFMDPNVRISLDIILNGNEFTITRIPKKAEEVEIIKNGTVINFDSIQEATEYLSWEFFSKFTDDVTRFSFRSAIAPLIRDEGSEFKDILNPFDTKLKIPTDSTPHLFYLWLATDLYTKMKELCKEFDLKTKSLTEVNKSIKLQWYDDVESMKVQLNQLDDEVKKINASMNSFQNDPSFQVIQDDILTIEDKLQRLRTERQVLKSELKKLSIDKSHDDIKSNEIALLFREFSDTLGNLVEKSLEDVLGLQKRVSEFKRNLLSSKIEDLKDKLNVINLEITKYDTAYSEKILLTSKWGEMLNNIKASNAIFQKKSYEFSELSWFVDNHKRVKSSKDDLKARKASILNSLREYLIETIEVVDLFEESILDIHYEIYWNKSAHFSINTLTTKDVLDFDLRIDNDGSHSVNRMKVFIYDFALLTSQTTKDHHPWFLLHDNIFDSDDHTLLKTFNLIHKKSDVAFPDFQYILTANIDLINHLKDDGLLEFDETQYIRASYTREKRFLYKGKYIEKKQTRKSWG